MEDCKYFREMFLLIHDLQAHEEHKHKTNITKGEGSILYVLMKHPNGITPGELAAILQVGSGRIGNALKNMEKKNIILRKQNPDDKRKTMVTLTEKGKALIYKMQDELARKINYTVKMMGEEKFNEYLTLCKEFVQYFTSEGIKEAKTHA